MIKVLLKFTVFICIIFGTNPSFSQCNGDRPIEMFSSRHPKELAHFPGCEELKEYNKVRECSQKKLIKFIYSHLRYPVSAQGSCIEGTVVISFAVGQEGHCSDFVLRRDIGGGCGEEAMRVLQMMPQWVLYEDAVYTSDMTYNMPVKFKLD